MTRYVCSSNADIQHYHSASDVPIRRLPVGGKMLLLTLQHVSRFFFELPDVDQVMHCSVVPKSPSFTHGSILHYVCQLTDYNIPQKRN